MVIICSNSLMLRTLVPKLLLGNACGDALRRGTRSVPDGGKMMKMVFFLATNRDALRPALQSKATGIPNQRLGTSMRNISNSIASSQKTLNFVKEYLFSNKWIKNVIFYGELTMNAETMQAPLLFSDSAATKVQQLIQEEDNNDLMLRVFVQGGGCSGFQYGFTFDENIQEGDTVVENQGVKLLIDPMSYQYLLGAEIDYTEGLEGSQFVIRNPNAVTTCGCGSSFSV